jgi:antitoxin MazE
MPYCNYDVIMRAQIIQIGNSQGIRIPKILLEETKISGEVELEVCSEGILIRNISKPRSGWDAAFRELSETDDDALPMAASAAFDEREWQW